MTPRRLTALSKSPKQVVLNLRESALSVNPCRKKGTGPGFHYFHPSPQLSVLRYPCTTTDVSIPRGPLSHSPPHALHDGYGTEQHLNQRGRARGEQQRVLHTHSQCEESCFLPATENDFLHKLQTGGEEVRLKRVAAAATLSHPIRTATRSANGQMLAAYVPCLACSPHDETAIDDSGAEGQKPLRGRSLATSAR